MRFLPINKHVLAANIYLYTHEFKLQACMHAAERLLFREKLSNGHSVKIHALEIYPLYGNNNITTIFRIRQLHVKSINTIIILYSRYTGIFGE